MKILKSKIEVNHSDNSTQYTYPKLWLDNKERIPTICYPSDRNDEIIENGVIYQIVYLVVPDDLSAELLTLPGFSLTTLSEVEAYADKHYPQKQRVIDEDKVISIFAKVALGNALTKEDKDALDPTNPVAGINMTRRWTEIAINDYGATF